MKIDATYSLNDILCLEFEFLKLPTGIKTCFLLLACPPAVVDVEEIVVAGVELAVTMVVGVANDFLAMTTGVGEDEAIERPLPPD